MRIRTVYARALAGPGRDRRVVAGLILANLVLAVLLFAEPLLFGRAVQMLADPGRLAGGGLWRDGAIVLGAWTAIGVAVIAAGMAASLQAERLAHRARLEAMRRFHAHVLALPPAFHGTTHSGGLMKIMLSGADALSWLWLSLFREQLASFAGVLVLLPLTLALNWRLALALVVLVAVSGAMTAMVVRRTEDGQRRAQRAQVELVRTAQDALANVVLVQSFARLAAERRLFGDLIRQVITHQFPVLTWWAVLHVLTRAASTIAVITLMVLGAVLHAHGQASVGEIVTFMGFATLLIGRLESAVSFLARLAFEAPNLRAYFGVLDTPSSVPDLGEGRPLRRGPDGSAGCVAFEAVGFAYPGGPPVLAGVSFTARPGMVVALVGPTGAGKSTAMNLLQRLWDPTAGRVLVDGQDLRTLTLESLRGAIGVVFQDSLLLNRSIRDNLLVGRPGAGTAELEHACRMADAYDFIIRQPAGFETIIGERGATLSGGQRQRLAIARALLRDPPILILDEATSALDAATEARVGRALRNLMQGRTTFIIAHRLSTVRDADEILVFEAGRIVERGDFAALLARGGAFADLVQCQLAPARPVPETTMRSLR